MWNLSFTPPTVCPAQVLTRLPDAFRQPRPTAWADANKPGHQIDSFLEGPVFDVAGNLYVTDIPYGRIFRIGPDLQWTLLAEYDGWPNGMALHPDGSLWIADYRKGLLRLDVTGIAPGQLGQPELVLGHRNSESFKGLNDLVFDASGHLYFTDQGQSGLHDPSGRVFRYQSESGRLDLLLGNAPSPNGIAVNADASVLFVAVTRGNQVWRGPLLRDGSVSKVGAFQTFFGTSGPDGLALLPDGRLLVAHASLGAVFVLNARGEITHALTSPAGPTVTNLAWQPNAQGGYRVVMTESSTGTIGVVDLPGEG